MGKITSVKEYLNIYTSLAENYAKDGELLKALDISISALQLHPEDYNLEIDIARIYADMGLYALSNKYLFKYLIDSPEEIHGVAFEELAVNFYYLDNYFASGYYFHEKIKKDGFINSDNLDDEILNFISTTENNTEAYYVAYPFEKADYSYRAKAGKRALALGDFIASTMIYSSIPEECRDEDISGDLAVSYLLNGDDEKVIEECKNSIEKNGGNVTAYTTLSNYFREKKNLDKAKYYYNKALETRRGDEDEAYKIATCAIELNDHVTALQCLDKIIEDRVYDDLMTFYRGIAKLNLGKISSALIDFQTSVMIDPSEKIYSYYAKLSQDMIENGGDNLNYFPLKYEKDYPKKISDEKCLIIKQIAKGKIPKKISVEQIFELVKWGLNSNKEEIYDDCFIVLTILNGKRTQWLLKETLINPDSNEKVKTQAFLTLMFNGVREKIPVINGPFFTFVKPRKMVFKNKEGAESFMSAYALCMTKCVFSGICETDKIAFISNKIYKEYREEVLKNSLQPEELATLILCSSGIEKLKDSERICKAFNIKYERIKLLLEKIKGEKPSNHDKNN